MNVSLYQQSSSSDYIKSTMPDSLRMYTAIQSYPRAAKNRSAELSQLRENGSPVVESMNFEPNNQALEVQFDSLVAPPQISTMPENELFNVRNSARAVKVLYEWAGTLICRMLRYMSRSPVKSARMCGYVMTVDMYDMICVVAEYVGIGVYMYASRRRVYYDADVSRRDRRKNRNNGVQSIFKRSRIRPNSAEWAVK